MKTKMFISDHAVVRWLERVHDINIEQIRATIAEKVQSAIGTGASALIMGNIRFELSPDGHVITVIKKDKKKRNRPKKSVDKDGDFDYK
jgi:hypothetical protein